MELMLAEEHVPESFDSHRHSRCVQQQGVTPVFMGSAYKNKGVQPLLDAIVHYLPSPLDRTIKAKQHANPEELMPLEPDPKKPLVAWPSRSSKIRSASSPSHAALPGHHLPRAKPITNQRTGQKHRFGRIVRMHAGQREEIDSAEAGDIIAVMGVDCASGDTYASEHKYCTLESMFVPEPVIKMAIAPANREGPTS